MAGAQVGSKGSDSPGTRITGNVSQWDGSWKLNPDPLSEQRVLIATVPSPWSLQFTLYNLKQILLRIYFHIFFNNLKFNKSDTFLHKTTWCRKPCQMNHNHPIHIYLTESWLAMEAWESRKLMKEELALSISSALTNCVHLTKSFHSGLSNLLNTGNGREDSSLLQGLVSLNITSSFKQKEANRHILEWHCLFSCDSLPSNLLCGFDWRTLL